MAEPDIDTVGALAWLQLSARRLGVGICMCDCPPELEELIAVTGLGDVLGTCCGSGVEVVGEPEQREHPRGVEEEADSRNPTV